MKIEKDFQVVVALILIGGILSATNLFSPLSEVYGILFLLLAILELTNPKKGEQNKI